jgi:hypothetical protein
MTDLYFDLSGDLKLSPNKDIASTQSRSQNDIQQIYIRLMTEPGDFYSYPNLGSDIGILYGMPQSPSTGEIGKRLIRQALSKDDIFLGRNITIEAVPTSRTSIRFDVHVVDNSQGPVTISVTQELN